jgi:hypothetical protein
MDTNSTKALAWALTNRATLHYTTLVMEQVMLALDSGSSFEIVVAKQRLAEAYEKAKETLEKGVPSHG